MNNRTLLIVFITGLLLLLAGKVFRGKRTGSFDPVIVAVDTSKVDRLKFVSGGPVKEEFELIRTGPQWEAVKGSMKVVAQPSAIKSILSPLADLNAKRIVTKENSKYVEYEIADDEAGRITAWQGSKQVVDLYLGGFRFDQVARTASSFVRSASGPEVYLIDGFVSMGLKARFEQFRDKKLVKSGAEDLTLLEWSGPSGQKQSIQKEDGAWYYAGMESLDSTAFGNYLTGLVNAQGSTFSELTSTSGLPLLERLTLKGNNMTEPTILSAYSVQDTLKPFLIHSSVNPEAIFTSDSVGLYKRIFTELRQFWPDGQ